MRTNLFPAILLAGPPHSGKSVLAYLLTQQLNEMGISHYLLRAVPDGEGNWFMKGDPAQVRALRVQNKLGYSARFVEHMRSVIDGRLLPLLVDIGGRPQGDQFGILKACTHSILLYRTPEEYDHWQKLLAEMDLLPVAEIRSSLEDQDQVGKSKPVLQGVITGLDRDKEKRKVGLVLGALLERVAGICYYEESYLEREHLRHAPYPVRLERDLGQRLGLSLRGARLIWEPHHLAGLRGIVPSGEPLALYGRGPVWLAAGLGVHSLPARLALFDVRYGWVTVPEVRFRKRGNLKVEVIPIEGFADRLQINPPGGVLTPGDLALPKVAGKQGIILSGPLPRWVFAALARQFAAERPWVGIDDPNGSRVIVVHSNSPLYAVGDTLSRETVG